MAHCCRSGYKVCRPLWGCTMKRGFLPTVLATGVIGLASCSPAPDEVTADRAVAQTIITPTALADIPAEVLTVVQAMRPGMVVSGAELKEREGRRYFDIEGMYTGAEIELDLLETPQGWQVVEIQRDVPWAGVPTEVASETTAAKAGFIPVRVIESVQASDGTVIYELFAQGQPGTPALEVRFAQGKAERLSEAWPH